MFGSHMCVKTEILSPIYLIMFGIIFNYLHEKQRPVEGMRTNSGTGANGSQTLMVSCLAMQQSWPLKALGLIPVKMSQLHHHAARLWPPPAHGPAVY